MRPVFFALLLVLLPALPACDRLAPTRASAPADTAAGEVPFELAGPGGAALVVPVHVNGQGPFDFVLDTGATLTCVHNALADSLALPESSVVGTAAGIESSGGVRVVSLDSLRVGAARAEELVACVVDLRHIQGAGIDVHGLVGLNFLSEFRVVLDFEREVLSLTQ